MAIVVETGSGDNPLANSYVSEAELTTYAADRGITLTQDESILLIKAMDYIESLNFMGTKKSKEQPLQWPRYHVVIDGYYIDSDVIPTELKKALMEVAVNIDADRNPLAPIERAVKREKVDVIEVEYMDGSSSTVLTPSIMLFLKKLLSQSGGANIVRVYRG